jgi:hypothetical protein
VKNRLTIILAIVVCVTSLALAQQPVAPAKGCLIISGGELLPTMIERFVTLDSWWYWLKPGDKFDLRTRAILR